MRDSSGDTRRCLLFAAALLCSACPARAQVGKINLSWNDCGDFGPSLATFACDVNTGRHELVGSFEVPTTLPQFLAIEAELEVATASGAMPDWWRFKAAGTCRRQSLQSSVDFAEGFSSCQDPWAGRTGVLGGVASNYIYSYSSRLAGIKLVHAVARGDSIRLEPGVEFYGFRLLIDHAKTVGDSACAGCSSGTGIRLLNLKLVQPSALNDNYLLTTPRSRTWVTWQCPGNPGGTDGGTWGFDCETPALPMSWGRIKALYR